MGADGSDADEERAAAARDGAAPAGSLASAYCAALPAVAHAQGGGSIGATLPILGRSGLSPAGLGLSSAAAPSLSGGSMATFDAPARPMPSARDLGSIQADESLHELRRRWAALSFPLLPTTDTAASTAASAYASTASSTAAAALDLFDPPAAAARSRPTRREPTFSAEFQRAVSEHAAKARGDPNMAAARGGGGNIGGGDSSGGGGRGGGLGGGFRGASFLPLPSSATDAAAATDARMRLSEEVQAATSAVRRLSLFPPSAAATVAAHQQLHGYPPPPAAQRGTLPEAVAVEAAVEAAWASAMEAAAGGYREGDPNLADDPNLGESYWDDNPNMGHSMGNLARSSWSIPLAATAAAAAEEAAAAAAAAAEEDEAAANLRELPTAANAPPPQLAAPSGGAFEYWQVLDSAGQLATHGTLSASGRAIPLRLPNMAGAIPIIAGDGAEAEADAGAGTARSTAVGSRDDHRHHALGSRDDHRHHAMGSRDDHRHRAMGSRDDHRHHAMGSREASPLPRVHWPADGDDDRHHATPRGAHRVQRPADDDDDRHHANGAWRAGATAERATRTTRTATRAEMEDMATQTPPSLPPLPRRPPPPPALFEMIVWPELPPRVPPPPPPTAFSF